MKHSECSLSASIIGHRGNLSWGWALLCFTLRSDNELGQKENSSRDTAGRAMLLAVCAMLLLGTAEAAKHSPVYAQFARAGGKLHMRSAGAHLD